MSRGARPYVKLSSRSGLRAYARARIQVSSLQQELETLISIIEETIGMTSGTPAEERAATVRVEQSVVDLRTTTITHTVLQEQRFMQRTDTTLNEI